MKSSLVWSFGSILLFLLCSIGYVIIDILSYVSVLSNSTLYIIYIVLASVLILEALLYTIDWAQYAFCQPKPTSLWAFRFKFLASLFHVIGSVVYLIGAIFGNSTVQDQPNLLTTPQLYIYNIIGTAAFLVEAILTFAGWMLHPSKRSKKWHCTHSINLWAHELNLIGALVYVVVSILPLIMTVTNPTLTQRTIYLNYVRPVQIAGDSVYVLDALLYLLLSIKTWHQNKRTGGDDPLEPESRHAVFLR